MMKKIERALLQIQKKLDENNISWALGGSLLLHYTGHKVDVHDIDILVDEKDYDKLLSAIGSFSFKENRINDKYLTSHFFTLDINGVSIDIMLGFKVVVSNGVYAFPFDQSKIEAYHNIQGVIIPLSSLEEWYKAYQAMERTEKVQLIKEKNQFN